MKNLAWSIFQLSIIISVIVYFDSPAVRETMMGPFLLVAFAVALAFSVTLVLGGFHHKVRGH